MNRHFIIAAVLILALSGVADAEDDPLALLRNAANHEAGLLAVPEPAAFESAETSKRTGGHLWDEVVVRTERGEIRRLTAIDGVPLSPLKADQESARIRESLTNLMANRVQQDDSDEHRILMTFVRMLPQAYAFTFDRVRSGCMQFHFEPNPAFTPRTPQEHALRAMAGTISIDPVTDQICNLTGKSEERHGFGLLGKPGDSYIDLIEGKVGRSQREMLTFGMHFGGQLPFRGATVESNWVRSHFQPLHQDLTSEEILKLLSEE